MNIVPTPEFVRVGWPDWSRLIQRFSAVKNMCRYHAAVNRGLQEENKRLKNQIEADIKGRIRKIGNELQLVRKI